MYNQEIKERFLAEYTANWKTEGRTRAALEIPSDYEYTHGKDFAEMTVEEAVESLSGSYSGTYKSVYAIQTAVRAYVKWCVCNSVFENVNPALENISVIDIDTSNIRDGFLFRSEEELIAELRSVRPFEDGYPEVVVMLFVWLGVKQKDVSLISISDVDVKNRRMYLPKDGRCIVFSDAIADVLSVYESAKVGSRPSGGRSRNVYRDDSHNKYVRKYFPEKKSGDEFTSVQIKHLINHLNSAYSDDGKQPRFTGSNVLISGALHRVWMLECSGVDVFSIKNKKLVLDAFVTKAKLHEILWMYENYKQAFNL